MTVNKIKLKEYRTEKITFSAVLSFKAFDLREGDVAMTLSFAYAFFPVRPDETVLH